MFPVFLLLVQCYMFTCSQIMYIFPTQTQQEKAGVVYFRYLTTFFQTHTFLTFFQPWINYIMLPGRPGKSHIMAGYRSSHIAGLDHPGGVIRFIVTEGTRISSGNWQTRRQCAVDMDALRGQNRSDTDNSEAKRYIPTKDPRRRRQRHGKSRNKDGWRRQRNRIQF